MRTKSLPISVRANPRHSSPTRSHSAGSGTAQRRPRWLDTIATIVMVALVPALLLPYSNVEASPTPPTIVARKAGPGDRVSILATVAVRFDRPVVGISDETFVLRDARGRIVPARIYYNPTRYRAALVPIDALRAGEPYRASLSTEIRTPAGVALTSASWSFRTTRQPSEATRFEQPRAVRFAPGRVTGIQVDAGGRVISSVTGRLASHSWAMADAIAVIRGRSYYDIADGIWAGHFVPAEAIVDADGPSGGSEPTPTPSATPAPTDPPGSSEPSPSPEPTAPPSTASPTPQPTPEPPVVQPPTAGSGIVISPAELRALPTSGGAWDALKRAADRARRRAEPGGHEPGQQRSDPREGPGLCPNRDPFVSSRGDLCPALGHGHRSWRGNPRPGARACGVRHRGRPDRASSRGPRASIRRSARGSARSWIGASRMAIR